MEASPRNGKPWAALAAATAVMVALLIGQGRTWWCACGGVNPWVGDIWTAHCSQHLIDAYSFTHVLHGIVLYGLVAWLLPRLTTTWRLVVVTAVEGAWEVLENSNFLIQRYREATIALGYTGDTITNSLSDLACCAAGFYLARRLGLRRSIVVYVVSELVLLVWVRDNLTLNVLMLVYPIEAIKTWQAAH